MAAAYRLCAAEEFLCPEKRVALGPRGSACLAGGGNFFSVSWPDDRAELWECHQCGMGLSPLLLSAMLRFDAWWVF